MKKISQIETGGRFLYGGVECLDFTFRCLFTPRVREVFTH